MTTQQLELGFAERQTPIATRSVVYHVAPLKKNDLWRANLDQLLRRADVFNGERVCAVATGPDSELHHQDAVRAIVEPRGFEVMPVRNCKRLREVASFGGLLRRVCRNVSSSAATFYAHTKGNSTAGSVQGSTYWRNAMYYHLLTRWERCMRELERHAAVGTHKMVWPAGGCPPYPTRLMHGHWMFAGTFFWFRNDAVFAQDKALSVPSDRYGAEAWLSGLFEPHECRSVFQPWPERQWPAPNPYSPELYREPIEDGCYEPPQDWQI